MNRYPVDKSSYDYVNSLATSLYYGLKDKYIWLKGLCKKLQAENKNMIWRMQQLEMENIKLREEMKLVKQDFKESETYRKVCEDRNHWKNLYLNTIKFQRK